jgi:hypothetical protein
MNLPTLQGRLRSRPDRPQLLFGYRDGVTGFRFDEGRQPPEFDVSIVDSDGTTSVGPVPPRAARTPTGNGRRFGILLGVVVMFAFGVTVGRSTIHVAPGAALAAAVPPTSLGPTPPLDVTSSPARAEQSTGAGNTAPAGTSVPPGREPGSPFAAAISGFAEVQSLAMAGDQLLALTPGNLIRISRNSDGSLNSSVSSVGLPFGDPDYAQWELISDGNTVWAAAPALTARMYRVYMPTLELTQLYPPLHPTIDLTAMGGALYQNTRAGVFEITTTTDPKSQLLVAPEGQAIAADLGRNHILVLNDGERGGTSVVRVYAPPKKGPIETSALLPFIAHSVVVAGGEIWVTGTASDVYPRPVLAQLDPATLKVSGYSELQRSLTSTPVVVAAGEDLWVRSKDTGDQLWCVDAHTGDIAQHWSALPGTVAAQPGQVYVADRDYIGELALGGSCTG